MSPDIVGLVLAAGQGTRFGSNKLLCKLGDGMPMVLAPVRTLQKALEHVVVVIDGTDTGVAALLNREQVDWIPNPRARQGMGTSIACGVTNRPATTGWVIALGDMPYVPAGIVEKIATRLGTGSSIVAPAYHGVRGHPVGFASRHRTALSALDTDEGARRIIEHNADALDLVETLDDGVVTDIDHPESIRWQL